MKRSSMLLSLLLVLAQGATTPALAKPTPASPKSSAPAAKKAAGAPATPSKKAGTGGGTVATQGKGKQPCFARPVQLVRVRGQQVEPRELSLTLCNGGANPAALDSLSVLARPRDVERPLLPEIRAYRARPLRIGKAKAKAKVKYRDPLFVSERVMRVHPGLLVRLQKVANRYPGKIIEIISGYRPDARDTSRHHHGQALDLRVSGVTREQLRDFLRSFEETGVGYYPNSYFVHMDVRDAKGYWVDRSGPGEPADYGPWPAERQDVDRARETLLKTALADLSGLRAPKMGTETRSDVTRPAPKGLMRVKEPEQESDDMSADEVARVRVEARQALEDM